MIGHVEAPQGIAGSFPDNGFFADFQNTFEDVVNKLYAAVFIYHHKTAGKRIHQRFNKVVVVQQIRKFYQFE